MVLRKLLAGIACFISVYVASCGLVETPDPTVTPFAIGTAFPTVVIKSTNTLLSTRPTNTNIPLPTTTSSATPTPFTQSLVTPTKVNKPGFIASLQGPNLDESIAVPAFSPDGKMVALASSTAVKIWNIEKLQSVKHLRYPYPECWFEEAVFSPDTSLFAVSAGQCGKYGEPGRLVVWDLKSEKQLADWSLEWAEMGEPGRNSKGQYQVGAFAFIPSTSKMIFASGNTLQIRDILKPDEPPEIIKLGNQMFASQLSFNDAGSVLYVLMNWKDTETFPALYKTKMTLQMWSLKSYTLLRQIKYPEVRIDEENMELSGHYLIHTDYYDATSEIIDLQTEETRPFLYRKGATFWSGSRILSPDRSRALVVRVAYSPDEDDCIEIWDTDTWRNIYTFKVGFEDDMYYGGIEHMAIDPSNSVAAFAHEGRLILWNISVPNE